MRHIAIINQKGGVGKTTTTVNLGMGLARAGYRVLLIDLDPQAHLSLHLGVDPAAGPSMGAEEAAISRPGVYELLTGSASIAKARVKAGNNLWLVGSSIDLAAAEVDLAGTPGRETILRGLLEQHLRANTSGRSGPYDFIITDCPPSLNILTINALCAASEVLIPLQPHYLALQGLGKLLETVSLVSKGINPGLIVAGVIVCLHDAGTKLGAEVIEDVRAFFENDRGKPVPWSTARVFNTVIRRNIKLAESPSYGQSIYDYAPDSNGARDYEQLVRELVAPADQESDAGGKSEGTAESLPVPAEEMQAALEVAFSQPAAPPDTPAALAVAPVPADAGEAIADTTQARRKKTA
jgi:chromosome partitioning protein